MNTTSENQFMQDVNETKKRSRAYAILAKIYHILSYVDFLAPTFSIKLNAYLYVKQSNNYLNFIYKYKDHWNTAIINELENNILELSNKFKNSRTYNDFYEIITPLDQLYNQIVDEMGNVFRRKYREIYGENCCSNQTN